MTLLLYPHPEWLHVGCYTLQLAELDRMPSLHLSQMDTLRSPLEQRGKSQTIGEAPDNILCVSGDPDRCYVERERESGQTGSLACVK